MTSIFHQRDASLLVRLCMTTVMLGVIVGVGPVWAQSDDERTSETQESRNPYGSGMGFELLLTNNGFGLGGYYRKAAGPATSFWLETYVGSGKDERESKFFSRFGGSVIPDKRNYLMMLPVQLGMQRRLFQEHIEENFRPYVQVSAGPTLGWEYPYFDDRNGNETYDDGVDRRYDSITAFPKGSLRFGGGGTLAVGAYFGISKKVTQSVRIGYTFNYFAQAIQLLEPGTKSAQHFFHTPVISITFGRLF